MLQNIQAYKHCKHFINNALEGEGGATTVVRATSHAHARVGGRPRQNHQKNTKAQTAGEYLGEGETAVAVGSLLGTALGSAAACSFWLPVSRQNGCGHRRTSEAVTLSHPATSCS